MSAQSCTACSGTATACQAPAGSKQAGAVEPCTCSQRNCLAGSACRMHAWPCQPVHFTCRVRSQPATYLLSACCRECTAAEQPVCNNKGARTMLACPTPTPITMPVLMHSDSWLLPSDRRHSLTSIAVTTNSARMRRSKYAVTASCMPSTAACFRYFRSSRLAAHFIEFIE
jgi:hypothetical protein